MTWLQRYRIRQYLLDTVWIFPSVGVFVALLTAWLVNRVDLALGWRSSLTADAARGVLVTLASGMFTFIIFVASALLIALQLASVQLTPRIIAFVFRDPVTKVAMTLFVFAFTFTIAAVIRTRESVPWLTTQLASYSCVISLIAFFYLLDHVGSRLRPSGALRRVAHEGLKIIELCYPRPLGKSTATAPEGSTAIEGRQTFSIPAPRDGVLLACDITGIVATAERAGCVLQLVPQVGDFVGAGSALFHVFGDGSALSPDALCQLIAIGHERSMEQDPAFAFRIMVDIACKALSPAINDPTTAVLAIDQIHHLLQVVGRRYLDDERVFDGAGQIRLLYRTPGWEDFVSLAVTEIRQYGGESIQINRRLRAMLENLIAVLPEERGEKLRSELKTLQRSAARLFKEPEDRALATVSDSQGVGGRSETAAAAAEPAIRRSERPEPVGHELRTS
jgi:uncharacterized membrane protein